MPFEEINVYTPELYRSLGTPVRLDLGSTALDVTATRKGVEALPQVVATALQPLDSRITTLNTTMSTQVGGAVTQLKIAHAADIKAASDAITLSVGQQVQKVLDKLDGFQPAPAPAPTTGAAIVTSKNAALVRWLAQVLTLAVDANPGQPDKQNKAEFGENVALQKLLAAAEPEARQLLGTSPDLLKRYLEAFTPFATKDFDIRHRRFTEVHALIPVITAHLG
ncbi:hypothetical protein ACS5PN_03100 [Roseateles sp. NT4]|uniref:hypothetical protein n=1 Tax=Roseateles sp. NT4 TaxID=3453715 RepID=UPI003EECB0AF